ncbi:MAG TPA: FkbM family methyltransferase [Roseobacter sp.]|uniref:Methyltransferase FkbM domain-containing protein n=1 Tax=marine sediment metagenome TaxID=412755 RepID=A0A0F9PVC5_9ZZZZ|nr:FkbM family methyltransferase [Roseobacter sp.]HEC71295.1 FkbM family methyltransferase [Roseobacter sp.]
MDKPDKQARRAARNQQPLTEDERKARRRAKRNLRHAEAMGFLKGVTAMLKPGDLALDCGANVGVVSSLLADTGADVISYEPDPYAFAQLSDALGDRQNVQLINAAVGASSGNVRLMRASNFDEDKKGASVKSTIVDGGRMIAAENYVDVKLLDFLTILSGEIENRGEIAFVKMDIEGAELELLEAMDAADLIRDIRCLVVETHERKFAELRPRFRALREAFSEKYPKRQVNLDWI